MGQGDPRGPHQAGMTSACRLFHQRFISLTGARYSCRRQRSAAQIANIMSLPSELSAQRAGLPVPSNEGFGARAATGSSNEVRPPCESMSMSSAHRVVRSPHARAGSSPAPGAPNRDSGAHPPRSSRDRCLSALGQGNMYLVVHPARRYARCASGSFLPPGACYEMPKVPAREHCRSEVLRGVCCVAGPGQDLCQLWKRGVVDSQVLRPVWLSSEACY
jgi:hypothetical protein